MRKVLLFLLLLVTISCGRKDPVVKEPIITVSIGPFRYFVEGIAGSDFVVNVMVPPGSNPHIYEPFPEQINKLRRSVAYISNGYLGFEMTWLDRFYETNKTMKKLSLGDMIDPIDHDHEHEGEHVENADPHYWVSPKCALIMAAALKEFLCDLRPERKEAYETNYKQLVVKILEIDKRAEENFSKMSGRSFMIYHPNLGYLARDYGLKEVSVEFEGKEPPPSRMKELIDLAREERLNTVFVQKEYDAKNAKAIAGEIGASVKIIDPLSENWYDSTLEIIEQLYSSLADTVKN
jgi:zinc transport system substrate-binding protein